MKLYKLTTFNKILPELSPSSCVYQLVYIRCELTQTKVALRLIV